MFLSIFRRLVRELCHGPQTCRRLGPVNSCSRRGKIGHGAALPSASGAFQSFCANIRESEYAHRRRATVRSKSENSKTLALSGEACVDTEGVDVACHHVRQCLVYEPVSMNTPQTAECVGDDRDPEMSPAVAGAGVTDMQVALVVDLEELRGEGGFESRADLLRPFQRHGIACLKGFTITDA